MTHFPLRRTIHPSRSPPKRNPGARAVGSATLRRLPREGPSSLARHRASIFFFGAHTSWKGAVRRSDVLELLLVQEVLRERLRPLGVHPAHASVFRSVVGISLRMGGCATIAKHARRLPLPKRVAPSEASVALLPARGVSDYGLVVIRGADKNTARETPNKPRGTG